MMHLGRFLEIKGAPLTDDTHHLLVQNKEGSEMREIDLCLLTDNRPQAKKVFMNSIQVSPGAVPVKAREHIRGVTSDMLTVLDLHHLLSDPGIIVHDKVR